MNYLAIAGTVLLSSTFNQTWQDRVVFPLSQSQVQTTMLVDVYAGLPNGQAYKFDVYFTGVGFPWINLRALSPSSCLDTFNPCGEPQTTFTRDK